MRGIELLEQNDKQAVKRTIKGWRNRDAAEYAEKLINHFGPPDENGGTCLYWRSITPFYDVYIIDESVTHLFPEPHRDYVYSTLEIPVDPELYTLFGKVTGSIIIDGLKNQVTARCGTLFANAVTLGFVQDVINRKVSHNAEKAKKEYARRIKKGVLPEWYPNSMKE